MYGTLQNNTFIKAPNPIRITIFNPTDEQYEQHGYKPTVEEPLPEYDPETQELVENSYEADGVIHIAYKAVTKEE